MVCHGGRERLPILAASLDNLNLCKGVSEIVVVNMGSAPWAEEIARARAHKYIFIRNDDVFERARALNAGTAITEYDLVLWKDNDLIMAPSFSSFAVAEMRERQLDFLLPYTAVNYLSEVDSQRVIEGTREPSDCIPVRVLRAATENTGAGQGL